LRKYSVVAGLVLAIAVAGYIVYSDVHAQAQPTAPAAAAAGHGQGRGAKMLARLSAALNLTPDQVAKIKPILKDERGKMEAIRNDSTLTDDQQKAAMLKVRMAANLEIKPILTPDQIAKFKTLTAKMRMRPAQGHGG
jgi:Spy/CpxP family protein refolding chaperone